MKEMPRNKRKDRSEVILALSSAQNDVDEQSELKAEQNSERDTVSSEIEIVQRYTWGNKAEYILATLGYAVGFGNLWRFPYLCQKNGGGAFLIPYFTSLVLLGIPLFFLELAIGQSIRQGPIGVWRAIHPYLGGVGVASAVACLLVAMYYNMIIAWCFFYLFVSFQDPLPYSSCPLGPNCTTNEGCILAGRTQYFWYTKTLGAASSIEKMGEFQWHLCLVLFLAWALLYLFVSRGVRSVGKAVYITATLPYIVLAIFFGRAVTLKGSLDGIIHMFKPEFSRLLSPIVWLEAVSQVFFSVGVGFGTLIAMSSYNHIHNNCKRDAIFISLTDSFTSVFAAVVVFSMLGFKATTSLNECQEFWFNKTDINGTDLVKEHCHDLEYWLSQSASGPGLTFIAFTEAIVRMPASPIWSVLFFCMLLTLGMGSMFGTLEGVITPFYDMKIVPFRKEIMTAMICGFCFLCGIIFTQQSGQYWLQMFDNYCATLPLLLIGFCELVGVSYIYKIERFEDDIQYMLGFRPHLYWKICWRYISPGLIIIIFIASIVNLAINPMQYSAWDKNKYKTKDMDYPGWGYAIIVLLISLSVLNVPIVALLRFLGILKYEKPASKPNSEGVLAPGSVTPSLSRVPLPPMEMPLAGTRDDED
ncbi:PREDICTED: sodium-dependent neutral amino acid transporter B(0)AT1-like isoform X1 [Acropora digitifera]|uniref:sodium-dependent neutral amino acid transporter B(0)AT1-like isoform X1 n=1 Tax=Acropora digitifera TaxID=70779 RepID=UPI00077B1510|nr:PREDICTED: sodium-dependent neutral amino acid transporter B(0)AT1-like isoform X1 [Acropora digitifera]